MPWFIFLIIGFAGGFVAGWWMARWRKGGGAVSAANAARRAAVERAHEKVLALFEDPSTGSGQVTNDDVQRALGVSDTTATDYLSALEARGRIRQVGTAGRPVYYIKK